MSHPTARAPDDNDQGQEADSLLLTALALDASFLHLKVGHPPFIRVSGGLRSLAGPPLRGEDLVRIVQPLLSPSQQQALVEDGQVEFSRTAGPDGCRFHLGVFRQRGDLSLVARRVHKVVPTVIGLGLPDTVERLCATPAGLIVIAGPPGSGKRTTVAAMLDHINQRRPVHILTVEDCIQFDLTDKLGCVHQREAGSDFRDKHKALDEAVRQGPDVLFIGELRDAHTAEVALHTAARACLVIAAVNSPDASSAICHILEMFPPERRPAIRKLLANNLKAVVAQMLVAGLKKPLVSAVEVLIANPTIKKLIEEGEETKLQKAIQLFYQEGMCDFTEQLKQMVDRGDIDKATALEHAPQPEKLKMAFKGIKVSAAGWLPESLPAPAAPALAPAPVRPAAPLTVRRQATVRYFTRMYPNQLYRLLVVLSEQEVRQLVAAEVGQAAGKDFRARLHEPVEVEPVLPGCTVYPPRLEIALSRDGPAEARFQVLAHVQGGSLEGASVVISQAGRELARVSLAVRVGRPTLAYCLAAASVALPAVLKYLKLDLDAQTGAEFSGYFGLVNAILSLPWWLWTVPLLLAAGVALWWCWPREDVFWDIELVPRENK
jgi:twitching motility protein PilT